LNKERKRKREKESMNIEEKRKRENREISISALNPRAPRTPAPLLICFHNSLQHPRAYLMGTYTILAEQIQRPYLNMSSIFSRIILTVPKQEKIVNA